MTCASGAQSRLLIEPGGAPPTFDGSSEYQDFLYCTVAKKRKLITRRGITGTRSVMVERTKLSQTSVDGRLALDASPLVFDRWLPRILGGTKSVNTIPIAETLPSFCMLLDAVTAMYRYDDCYASRAVLRGQADPEGSGGMLELVVDIMAKAETLNQSWPGSPPTLSTAANATPYVFQEGVLTIGGTVYPITEFTLLIDNHIDRRWTNSVTATDLCPQDRTVMLRTNNPFTSSEYTNLYNSAAAISGVAATLVFTNSPYSATFTFAGLTWADHGPEIQGKSEIMLPLEFWAMKKGSTAEISVTNVSS
jgi:hypothetical protein